MNKPFLSGLLFGVGFSIIFAAILAVLNVFFLELEDRQHGDRPPLVMGPGEPTVVRAKPVVRNGKLMVLITVRNDFSESVFFRAETVTFDQFGEYFESAPALREFHVSTGKEFHFTSYCPSDELDQDEILNSVSKVEMQFFRT
ncbi:MAG: hypothetical protein OER22_08710 [Gammaproteobacteria bacterium]|nr:hypothetical protein [Gammaproteobacteria bacterium]